MQSQKLGGRYKILKYLGEGSFGVTFVAEDTQQPGNPRCVVKQFKPKATDPYTLREAQRLFDQEAQMLQTLGKHDQIPRLLAHIEENHEFYLVQEFIEGHDLTVELAVGKQLSEALVIQLLRDILEVLVFVHQQAIIHRDIKPSNIRRRQDGKIVLIDFGAVKQISTQFINAQGQTSFTVAIGTPGYMPSEQANRHPKLSSDVYAVGMIGIQALTGTLPLNLPKDSQTDELVWRHLTRVNPKLADILDKMVRYDFRQRHQSASEALQALMTLVPDSSTSVNKPKPFSKVLIGSAIALISAIIIAVVLTPHPQEEIFSNYTNATVGIKMKYPENWKTQNIQNITTGEIVTFLSPQSNNINKSQEKLTISVIDYPGTLYEFKNTSIQDINNHLTQPKIENQTDTTLANKPASQLIYTGKDGDNSLKSLQVFTLKNDKAYVITYTAEIDSYEQFLKTAETMIQSVEIN